MEPDIEFFSKRNIATISFFCLSTAYYIFNWSAYENCAAPIQIFLVAFPLSQLLTIMIFLINNLTRSDACMNLMNWLFIIVISPFVAFLSFQGIIWWIIIISESPNCITASFQIPWFWIIGSLVSVVQNFYASYILAKHYWIYYGQFYWQYYWIYNRERGNLDRQDQIVLSDVMLERLEKKIYQLTTRLRYDERICSICHMDFQVEEEIVILPQCEHAFHSKCVTRWLKIKPHCPICRTIVHIEIANEDLEMFVRGNPERPPPEVAVLSP